MPDPRQKALLSVILYRFLLFVILHERAKLQYSDAFIGDLAIANAFDSLVPAPAHSANWQPMCAITYMYVCRSTKWLSSPYDARDAPTRGASVARDASFASVDERGARRKRL